MQIDDIIEIENDEYYVVDLFELDQKEYVLLNLLKDEIQPEDSVVLRVDGEMVYSIDDEEEAKKVITYLDSKIKDGE